MEMEEVYRSKITNKYILTNDNYDKKNLDEFIKNCIKYKLDRCAFQISVNFKYDELRINYLKSIIYLMNKYQIQICCSYY